MNEAEILDEANAFVAGLDDDQVEAARYYWPTVARRAQLPPPGDWTTWLLMGGRGSGKTMAGAQWIRGLALGLDYASPAPAGPAGPLALISETQAQARAVMVEGISGLLAVHGPSDELVWHRSRGILEWPNGTVARLFGASDPEALRGHQFAAAWCDEAGKWTRAEAAFDMLQFGLRLGARPRQVITTTPRPTALLKRLRGEPGTVIARMRTAENARHLAPAFLSKVVARYQGSVLGRQELDGVLVEDDPDALWARRVLDQHRLGEPPELQRIVVAVDPPVTSHARSDACGIVVAGRAGERAAVLEDLTMRPAPPLQWAMRAVRAFERHRADCIVAEVNQGGELVANLIGQVDRAVPVREVRASRSKWSRAEPVAALYARGLVSHVGLLADLEDEMCIFGRDRLRGRSPDRVDALVWALTELMLAEHGEPRVRNT